MPRQELITPKKVPLVGFEEEEKPIDDFEIPSFRKDNTI